MKLADSPVQVQSNAQFDETFAVTIGTSAEAVSMVIERLISAYKNPYRAVLREYTSNAYDEHVAAGVKVPVEVSLPDSMSPVLKVQDFGRGLTRDELKGFGTIGNSTKRHSNDLTGGFGMGSKSALAAAPQFTVTSVKNGRRNTVVVARDEKNVPQMQFLPETDTDDETGTTIVVPISDVTKFENLDHFWLGWKPGTILVDGKEPKNSVYITDQYKEVGGGAGYRSRSMETPGRDVIRVLINQVFYELSYKDLNISYQQWNNLKFYVLRLENGEVDIAPSRETLLFNARTKAHVAERIQKLLSVAALDYAESIEKAIDVKDALRKLNQMEQAGYPITNVKFGGKRIVLPNMTIDGNRVPDHSGTWAQPTRQSNTKTGWMVEKNWSTLMSRRPHMFTEHHKFVIIHSAGQPTSYGTYYNRTAHREAFGVADWLTTIDDAWKTSWSVFITSETPKRLNYWLKETADVFISANDFNKIANEVKAERARQEREARASGQAKSVNLKVIAGRSYGTAYTREYSAADIKATYKKVIFLRNQDQSLEGVMRDSLMTKKNADKQYNETAWKLQSRGDIALILIGKNDKVDDYLPLLPPVTTFGAEAAEAVTATFKKIKKIEKMALRDRNEQNVSAVSTMPDDKVAMIKRKETRDWIRALKTFRDDGKALRESYAWMRNHSPEVKAAFEAGEKTQGASKTLPESPINRYPLLRGISYYSVSPVHVVEYINMMDKANKG